MSAPAPDPRPALPPGRRRRGRRLLAAAGVGLVALLGVAQLVPFGHSYVPFGHPQGNPPVTRAAVWPDASPQRLAESACYDCHSNLTRWWLGTKVAPGSWLAQADVNGGRERLNLSEWDGPQPALDEVTEVVESGSMPPFQYTLVHPSARLDDAERRQLVAGLRQLYATDPPAAITGG